MSGFLIDIHSQHQTREILNEEYQLEIIDAISNNSDILVKYSQELKQFNTIKKQLSLFKTEKETLSKEQEYNSFLLNELLLANLKEGEQELLEDELEQLSNVEFIGESLDKALQISNDEQVGILINLNDVKQSLQKIAGLSKNYLDVSERVNSIQIEFQDIINECSSLSEKVINDPERLEAVNTKLQSIYSLQKKHQVNSVEDLIAIREDLDTKVMKVDDLDFQINKLEIEVAEAQSRVDEYANQLSERRISNTSHLSTQIETILSSLGMSDAQIQFNISQTDSYFKSGKDTIETLFTSNKGMQLGMLKKVASGGEMSRIMLAIKAVMANYTKLPSIIFDEIDTGVSGEIAIKIGEIMKEMSKNMQVFAITHLPQIAAKGTQHYKVYKFTENETTVSELKLLAQNERINEIAEMLSGKSISDSALNHAKALLN